MNWWLAALVFIGMLVWQYRGSIVSWTITRFQGRKTLPEAFYKDKALHWPDFVQEAYSKVRTHELVRKQRELNGLPNDYATVKCYCADCGDKGRNLKARVVTTRGVRMDRVTKIPEVLQGSALNLGQYQKMLADSMITEIESTTFGVSYKTPQKTRIKEL